MGFYNIVSKFLYFIKIVDIRNFIFLVSDIIVLIFYDFYLCGYFIYLLISVVIFVFMLIISRFLILFRVVKWCM